MKKRLSAIMLGGLMLVAPMLGFAAPDCLQQFPNDSTNFCSCYAYTEVQPTLPPGVSLTLALMYIMHGAKASCSSSDKRHPGPCYTSPASQDCTDCINEAQAFIDYHNAGVCAIPPKKV